MNDTIAGNIPCGVNDGSCARGIIIDLCSDDANLRNDAKLPSSPAATQTQPLFSQPSQSANDDDNNEDNDPDTQSAMSHPRSTVFEATVCELTELHKKHQQLLKQKKSSIHGEIFRHLAAECKKNVFAQSAVRARCSLGVIQTNSNPEYHDQILPYLAADVDQNIINTVVENIDVKYHGVRLFVKLLYGTFEILPSQELIDAHFRIAHKLALECYPTEQKHLHNAVTRRWMPRLKYNNNGRGDSLPMARQSVAIVWPYIVTNDPNELACFWTTLDMRLTAHSPQFPNPVDVCALRLSSSRARLQTIYSHKVIPCRQCRVAVDGLANYESSDEENQTRPISAPHLANKRVRTPVTCVCNNDGVLVQDGCVEPYCELQWDVTTSQTHILRWNAAAFLQEARPCNTLTMMRMHSIVPNASSHCQLRFLTPPDAPSSRDAIGFNVSHKLHSPFGRDLLCKLDENKFFSKILQMKTTFRLKATEHMDLYQLCLSLIRKVGASFSAPLKLPAALCKHETADDASLVESPYAHIVVHDIACNVNKKRLYINVQGRGSKYCYLHGGEHDEAVRVYFTISIDTFHVSVACNNPVCQKIITSYFDWLCAKKDHPKKKVTPNLTDVQMELLSKKMHYVISIEGDTRKKLMLLALDKHYTGPMERTFVLQTSQHASSQSVQSRESVDEDSMDDSDQELDMETCVMIPRRLLSSRLQDKLAFINKREMRKRARYCKSTQQSLPGRLAITEPFVEEHKRTVAFDFDGVTPDQLLNWKNQPSKFLL